MRLLLIRHGETVHNVANIYAGITDSALTSHGVLQANRLGMHLSATDVKISHIFSSDLQRARITAEAIRAAQCPSLDSVIQLPLLRERDFGSYEGKPFVERSKSGGKRGTEVDAENCIGTPGFVNKESKESMAARMNDFIDFHLVQLLGEVQEQQTVAVVAHGIVLGYLWKAILQRFHPNNVTTTPGVLGAGQGFDIQYPLGGWSNTGYLDLEVCPTITIHKRPTSSETSMASGLCIPPNSLLLDPIQTSSATPTSRYLNMLLIIKAVDCQDHLEGLKKTRGGIGSLKHDANQKTIDSFFKKRRTE